MIQAALAELLEGRHLSREQAREVMDEIMRGEATQAQIGGFLVALRLKGETADEIAGCAEAMRDHVLPVRPQRDDLVDTAGTGGDGASTINISTAAAIVAAAAGAGVAKHGNRAVSSASGSADVLEALGFQLEQAPERIAQSIDELGFGFMFAPAHHPAMRHAAPVRRELAARTVFNVLGPLTNPAGARAQVIGVYSPSLVRTLAEVLAQLGARRAFVVHGAHGIDELSPSGPNDVCEVVDGEVRERVIDPIDLGIPRCDPAELRGGSPAENAARDPRGLRRRRRRPPRRHPAERGRRDRGLRARGGPARGARAGPSGDRLRRSGASGSTSWRGSHMRFNDALAGPGLGAIAEIKRRSPSLGDIRPDADPAQLAAAYARAGAAAVSVLVDELFGGDWDDLRAARAATGVPLLAKGFFSTEEHLRTAKEAGADAVLLLLRDLDDAQVRTLLGLAGELGLDTLVEAHDADELERAVVLRAPVIGVNARDLSTFEIDRETQLALVARIPPDRVAIAESGVRTRAQGAAAELAGADAILVGSALMQAPDPAAKLHDLLARPLVKVCGLTREEDVAVAAEAGADLAGFILVPESPRAAKEVLPVPDELLAVAVWVGQAGPSGAPLDQVHERSEGAVRGRNAVLLRDGEEVARLLDLPWQQEDPDHWERAASSPGRVVLAGKLAADNVAEAIRRVRPWAVDASSRLESEPGIKDPEKVRAYVEAARG